MYYYSYDFWWWPFLFILMAGILPNAIWRWAGVFLVGNMDENSEWLVFVRCIATALVAAVIAQFVFFPSGALEQFPFALRVSAALSGFFAFLLLGRRMVVSILVGEAVLLVGYLLLQQVV